ncbi:MAG: hypothetical protein R3F29_05570 [Planctomycetota bacterium]
MKSLSSLLLIAALLPGQDPTRPSGGQQPGGQRPALRPMLLPQALVLPRSTEIVIDGSLVDWPDLPAVRLDDQRQLSGTAGGAWRGADDASGVVFFLWDDNSLYVAASVRDEWHRALDANTLMLTEIPAADSLMLTFDPDRNTRSNGPDPGRRDDREFWLADENAREVVQWDRLRGTARVLDPSVARMVVLHDKEHGVTSFEAQLPWSEILPPGRHAKAGEVIDLQLVFNDYDESTDQMPQTRLGWTFGMGPIVDPGLFGSLMLLADSAVLQGVVPEFPPKPGTAEPPALPEQHWRDLTASLLQHPPTLYDGKLTPAETGGLDRLHALEEVEARTAEFPRVDFLELTQRISRRMNREVGGLMGRGLPWWWRDRLFSVSKQAEDKVPEGAMRLFRLPMGGWLVRSDKANCMIDPAGNDIPEWLWGGAGFVVLTQPLDVTRRNDQLLVRMFAAKPPRTVFGHIVYHLPVVPMDKMQLTRMGNWYGKEGETMVHALGAPQADGTVPYDCSYHVKLHGAPELLVTSPTLKVEDLGDLEHVDVMIASPRNVDIARIAAKVRPRVILIDDVFACQSSPQTPRVRLEDAHRIQRSLLPFPSVLLAPGESWLVEPAGK